MLEDLLGVSECRIKSFSPIYHEEGVFAVFNFLLLENLVIIDVGHFPGELTNSKLAMSVEICQSRLVLPILRIFFEQGLDVEDLRFGEHLDVTFFVRFLHETDGVVGVLGITLDLFFICASLHVATTLFDRFFMS